MSTKMTEQDWALALKIFRVCLPRVGTWGLGGTKNRKFVQIGQGDEYQFCRPNRSAFEGMFAKGYYQPKLLVMAFLGNSAERWANSRSAATIDARETLAQIPGDTACVFMTTAPVFSKEINDLRTRAQENIVSAFQSQGNRCQTQLEMARIGLIRNVSF